MTAGRRRRRRGVIDYDALEREGKCECGRTLRYHPPLPRPGPLRSWKALRTSGRPITRAASAVQHRNRVRFEQLQRVGMR